MKLSLIAAMAKNRVIGKGNKMPWHLSADLKHFKQITLNKPIIMGRKTFESLGHPLPKRRNIVISRNSDLKIPGVEIFNDVDSALSILQDEEEVMIIGGQTIYEQTIASANSMYLTFIDLEVDGDAFFPAWSKREWQVVKEEKHCADKSNAYNYTFAELNHVSYSTV